MSLVIRMADLKPLRDELLASIGRWSPEINNAPARPTLRVGVVQKCYRLLDRMLEICTVEAVVLTGAFGDEALQNCCGGKPTSRMTLGERVQILVQLDAKMAKALRQTMPVKRATVLGKPGIRLLYSISTNRNLFTHDGSSLDANRVTESLASAEAFCKLDLVTMMIGIQAARNGR